MLSSPGGVHSYCFLLRIGFDDVFGDLLFLKCLFSLYMFVLMLPLIFSLRNFPL
nr:C4-dicarboxylate ABC transporter [Anabaena sp. FACHB-1237]